MVLAYLSTVGHGRTRPHRGVSSGDVTFQMMSSTEYRVKEQVMKLQIQVDGSAIVPNVLSAILQQVPHAKCLKHFSLLVLIGLQMQDL